uniref:Zinc ribbon-containing protein n=1 Tax=Rheinheimera sp. BAL341 TaxID=1708203 RepID=A0A486XMG1_9GAMM
MADFVKKYQRWLADFSHSLQQTEQQQLNNLVDVVEQLKAYMNAGKELSAYETQLFIETLKRQWQDHAGQPNTEENSAPSLWPEALWQELSCITDKSQLEWQELAQDFKHQGVYYQGEVVGMGRYRCSHCMNHIDYTHPAALLACSQCGGVQFFREGLPV